MSENIESKIDCCLAGIERLSIVFRNFLLGFCEGYAQVADRYSILFPAMKAKQSRINDSVEEMLASLSGIILEVQRFDLKGDTDGKDGASEKAKG